MSGLVFTGSEAETLVSAYQSIDLDKQRRDTVAKLPIVAGESILDVGSGPGFLCALLAERVGPGGRVVGVDPSQDLSDYSNETKSAGTAGVVDYVLGDAINLPVESDRFDIVTSTQVLQYVPDVDKAIEEIKRVLKPGGTLLTLDTDFDAWAWHGSDPVQTRAIMDGWRATSRAHPHLPRTFAARLRAQGFENIVVEAYPIVNLIYDQNQFSYSFSHLVADFLRENGLDRELVSRWLADLDTIEAKGETFFSLNRYIFMAQLPK